MKIAAPLKHGGVAEKVANLFESLFRDENRGSIEAGPDRRHRGQALWVIPR